MPAFAERLNVLGVGVSAVNLAQTLEIIERWVANGERQYVCITGVHGIMESQRDASVRRIHNAAGLVTPDGMPLVWLGRAKGCSRVNRVYGPDLMLAVCERSVAMGWRHFFFGAAEGVPDRLARRLTARFPGLEVVGACSPPFRPLTPVEDETITNAINGSAPDIVWVGLSTPKQERWMHEHLGRIQAPVMIGVGAAFDFHAGLKPQAPRWMQRSGLEWLFRVATEPRRLWRRYFVNNPRFVWDVLMQATGVRSYAVSEPGDVQRDAVA